MDAKVLRLWLYAVSIAVIFVSFLTISLWRSQFEFLRVGRLEVVGKNGKASVVVGSNANGDGVIMLYDSDGVLRAAVGVTSTGDAAIDLCDSKGLPVVNISVKADGTAVMKGLPTLP